MKGRWTVVFAVVLALSVILVGCSKDDSAEGGGNNLQTQSKTVLNIGVNTGVGTLDPARSGNGDPLCIFAELAYDPLIYKMPDGSYAPGLAESWQYVGSGNTIFEIELRSGVKFSDGAELTADGVKKHLEYYGSAGGPFASRIDQFESIDVTGPLSLRITLKTSNPELPFLFSQRQVTGSIISPDAIDSPDILGTSTAGAGQYMIDTANTVTDQTYTYIPNPNYWNPEAINWEKIVVKIVPEPNAMLSAVMTGEVDYAFGSPRTAGSAAQAGIEVQTQPYVFTQVQIMDRNGELIPALADVRVRQALNYAIDREAVATALYGDYGTANSQSSLPGADSWSDEYVNYYPYDPDRAKALLAEAGYGDGISIPMIAYNLQPGQTDAAAAIASEWAKVGIGTQIIVPVSFSDLVAKYPGSASWMFFYGIIPMYFMYSDWFGSGYANPYGVDDDIIDDLYARASAEPDPATRDQLWVQLQGRLLELAWMVPFGAQHRILYVRPGLKGVDLGPENLDPNPVFFHAE
jgi:ABC-type transport system substrate-binding protein